MKRTLVIIAFLISVFPLAIAEVYTFNTCGSDGREGPSQSDCDNFYSGDNQVDVIGSGIQRWSAPSSGDYRITAYGAQGGGSDGGLGAEIRGEFSLNEGDDLDILVGQRGEDDGSNNFAGGGGTFIEHNNDLIIVAGGGGGAEGSFSQDDAAGLTSTSGGDGDGSDGGCSGGSGGSGGSGTCGSHSNTVGYYGAAGYSGDGSSDAEAYLNGGLGGSDDADGGFGGGGETSSRSSWSRTGGGGGYSGGGASVDSDGGHAAGGGGSYNEGTNTSESSGENSGHGYVEIEVLTDPDDPIIQTPLVESKDGSTSPSTMDVDFDVDINYDDGDASNNELDYCEITVTGLDNGGSETYTDSNPSGDNCDFEIENDDNPNWDPGEEVEIEAYVEDSYDGTDTVSRNYEFPYQQSEITNVHFHDSHQEHSFEVTVEFDEGDYDVNSCSMTAVNDGSQNTYSGDIGDEECIFSGSDEVVYDDLSDWEQRHDDNDELIELDLEVELSSEEGFEDSWTGSHQFPNNDPMVQEIEISEYDDRHAFDIAVDIEFPDDGSHEPASNACVITLEGEDTGGQNIYESDSDPELDADFTYLGNDDAECLVNGVEPEDCESGACSGDFDFEVLEEITVTAEAFDHHEASGSNTVTNEIPNRAANIDIVQPSSGDTILERDVDLEASVDDPEGDQFDVVFRDSSDDVLESYQSQDDGTFSAEWEDLDVGEYTWTVEVDDSYEETSVSSNFLRVVSLIYRVQKNVDHPYSVLIVDEGGSSTIFLETSIETDDREVTTYLSGEDIEPEFQENDDDQKTYDLNVGDTERHQIMVEGIETGITELEITTEDDTVDVNTTETFPVYVQDPIAEGQQVPGLTKGYLAIIAVFSSLVYFALL